ncbi:unnamed protein product [Trifolium pratense]|uniref:Uncharacterized protein n=1 Tax=Trifolium pratense TaxID=57577 RepID=A0ACB0K507_TRIPR|nr:unnamed protein product [Trifolium pratense]
MGALHHLDLTRDVTHLIIGSYDTLKYKYVARNRQDILPMAPSWIDAIRDLWINDEEIDLEAMEQKYKLPTFHSLKFSMTGCEEQRLGISELVKKNGATYDGDLTRSITHLISLRTDGAKYKAAKSWGIKIVSIEWLYQSLERGMILEEKLFDPALPKEERGKCAWDKAPPFIPSLVRRLKPESNTGAEIGQRKLRRTASMKLSGQHNSLLADISGNSVVSKSQLNGAREFEKPTQIKRSAITDQSKLQTVQNYSEDQSPPKIKGVFTGCVFWLYDFPNTKIKVLQNHILSCGGEIMHTGNKLVPLPTVLPEGRQSQRLFMVVSHDLPKDDVPILPKKAQYAKEWKIPIVKVNWLWDSIETGSSLSTQAYEFRPEKMLESTLALKEKPLNIVGMKQKISSIVPVNPSLTADKDTISTKKRPPQPASNTSCEINDSEEKSKEAEKKVILIPSQSQAEPLVISNHPENNDSSLTHDMTMVIGPTEKSATLNRPSEDITLAISSLLAKSKGH